MKLIIDTKQQILFMLDGETCIKEYAISTGKNGIGQQNGSEQTPLGEHQIAEKIGGDLPENAVMVARKWTNEIYTPALGREHPGRDWILTRILWLDGLEPGFNQGGDVDTKNRYIYIHGTPDETELGKAGSRGCIRMRNSDLMALFDQVEIGTRVTIK